MFGFFIGKFIVRRAQAAINALEPKVHIYLPPDLPLPSIATIKRMSKAVSRINALEPQFEKYTDGELKAKTEEFRARYRQATEAPKKDFLQIEQSLREAASNEERDDLNIRLAAFKEELKKARQAALTDILPEAFAAVREAAKRTLGMRHYDIQLLGGMVLHEGRIAEMATGEGKTLVATLPAYLNGLTGEGVHVVTVNDYLARRDREWMGPVYEFLGLSVGVILHELNANERQDAYACDITYGTNNEFGFDYLRDNMVIAREEMVQAQHYFAIVDEVDSILVDEARTPLIISGPAEESTDKYYTANTIAQSLKGRRITEQEEIDAKYRNIDLSAGYDYVADEKNRSISMTEQGEEKAARMFGIDNLHDMETIEYRHHILQSLKAKEFFKRDVDYVVRDGEVLIVDEFTGRLMPGRRWSDGLHQAVEAKEGIKIERENQTLATITFQNYFRMYEKLSGMTGTAYTEANEFSQIYKLDCVVMPTNRPLKRENYSDCVYKSVREKFDAVVEEIAGCYQKGQPVLVGTISIEKSEYLSALLKQRGIPHQVLNAKYHELEAQIVAQAGRYQAVTIATNMAGRGTDIVLGGNAEFLARSLAEQEVQEGEEESEKEIRVKKFLAQFREQVKNEHQRVIDVGGLHVIGTERHEARRIDNQLRGRSGRQGDPGASRFFVSLEDDLMRLFASDRIVSLMEKLGMEEGQVIEHPWVTRAIEVAQKRVETQNFEFRKQLLEYDNVMNKQREAIYGLRRSILESTNVRDRVMEAIEDVLSSLVDQCLFNGQDEASWDLDGLQVSLHSKFHYDLSQVRGQLADMKPEEIKDLIIRGVKELYQQKEREIGVENMRGLEKVVLLNTLDAKWKDHLYAMDQLKGGVGLRSYGQRDPLIEYKREGYEMFQMMFASISDEVAEIIFKVQPLPGSARMRGVFDSLPQNFVHDEVSSFSGDTAPQPGAQEPPQPQRPQNPPPPASQPYHKSGPKVGRNDPCPCGSGKKYKKCCGS
ncbi:MAG TPA: preprotein translocase subunit SecA [Candidatus Omnitrophota bacterium]|nr:preprotein translocase subunit SecA [Candidatus Omnitrophota bacterium]